MCILSAWKNLHYLWIFHTSSLEHNKVICLKIPKKKKKKEKKKKKKIIIIIIKIVFLLQFPLTTLLYSRIIQHLPITHEWITHQEGLCFLASFRGKVAHSGKTFPFLERCTTACLSNSATLLQIPQYCVYFTF